MMQVLLEIIMREFAGFVMTETGSLDQNIRRLDFERATIKKKFCERERCRGVVPRATGKVTSSFVGREDKKSWLRGTAGKGRLRDEMSAEGEKHCRASVSR